jgi:hypothetical protein
MTRGIEMTRSKERRRWSPSDAQGVLEEWRRSGFSLARFARQQGYGIQRLQWWKGKLAKQPSAMTRFVPVELALSPSTSAMRGQASGWIEIALPEGIRLRVADSADPRTVAQLVAALREARC